MVRSRERMDPIADALADARARTHELVLDLDDAQWMGPPLPIVNPIRWEVAHVAWFQEKWMLRHARGRAPLRADGDCLYDSVRVARDARWDLPLPDRRQTLAYMRQVLDAAVEVARGGEHAYFSELALYHEDMHGEELTYTRQTRAYSAPPLSARASPSRPAGPWPGDAEVAGGVFQLGARPDAKHFVFDNEKWAHPIKMAPFRIARAPVTNEQFADFVNDGGYTREELWSASGKQWRASVSAERPVYWQKSHGEWQVRRYDRFERLAPYQPVIHVCWYEAEAYCRWARRRLPTEAEWELAAASYDGRTFPWGDTAPTTAHANLNSLVGSTQDVAAHPAGDSPYGCRQMIGNVWEWTATRFAPYPGFIADPYAEYSAPWFEWPHMVLRGGCWATRSRMLRNTWRNFFPPHRRDLFAGFRTCAV